MNPRQALILKLIVDEYIRTAEPVSSKQLSEGFDLNCSSATVRNDMAVLEELGLIEQPHTSAGRVPTEKGYRQYIQDSQTAAPVKQVRFQITVRQLPRKLTPEERLLQVGQAVVEAAGETVMLATNRPWSHTLGLAKLLRKPEFSNPAAILLLAESLEKLDLVYQELLASASDEVTVLLGSDNPFGNNLASVVVKSELGNNLEGVLGIVGPLRMNYSHNIALLTKAKKILEQPLLSV